MIYFESRIDKCLTCNVIRAIIAVTTKREVLCCFVLYLFQQKMIYFALCDWQVAMSTKKKKVKKFNKGKKNVAYGCVNTQTFLTQDSFKKVFGNCIILDLDQKLIFGSDFQIRPDYTNRFR